jgi:hypothetical protein
LIAQSSWRTRHVVRRSARHGPPVNWRIGVYESDYPSSGRAARRSPRRTPRPGKRTVEIEPTLAQPNVVPEVAMATIHNDLHSTDTPPKRGARSIAGTRPAWIASGGAESAPKRFRAQPCPSPLNHRSLKCEPYHSVPVQLTDEYRRRMHQPVSDLSPTIAEWLDLAAQQTFQGHSRRHRPILSSMERRRRMRDAQSSLAPEC